MVTRTRLGRFFRVLGLYCIAAAMIAYFAFHAQHGNYGIEAGRALKEEIANLTVERDQLVVERTALEHRNHLLKSNQIDPDLLEELARKDLAFALPNDLIMILRR
ncbi:MAG: septum formation initiator family protein [Rhizobiales bacterium]|jgi:cell division protein FtsB|nr:septum formation initiator family protein [Hyphomicrobiales bacterium]